MNNALLVVIEKPPCTVEFHARLQTATVTMFGKTYHDLPVKRRWLGESDYLYSIIVPIAKLPQKRWLLAISNDAVFGRKHPERQPFPDLEDVPVRKPAEKGSEQLRLWEGES